jgi:hypothetical protein
MHKDTAGSADRIKRQPARLKIDGLTGFDHQRPAGINPNSTAVSANTRALFRSGTASNAFRIS